MSEPGNAEKLAEVLKKSLKRLTDAMKLGDRITGLRTGFDGYDRLTSGLKAGEVTLIAGRPDVGKTSFALTVAANVARPRESEGHASTAVLVFSLEMPREDIGNFMMAAAARVDAGQIRQGFMSQKGWDLLAKAVPSLSSLAIWIDDAPVDGIRDLRERVLGLQDELSAAAWPQCPETPRCKIGLVVIDDLHLLAKRHGVGPLERVARKLSRGLKAVAKEMNVPIIAFWQLDGDEWPRRRAKRPQLSDLPGSDVRDGADTICFIHPVGHATFTEFIVARQPSGVSGYVKLRFERQFTRFDAPEEAPR